MKKIGIITFSDFNTNYGSMLQAFSMKIYLESLGHDVCFIRYREFNKNIKEKELKKRIVNDTKRILLMIYKVFKSKDIKQTEKNFEEFKKKFFDYTSLYTSTETLKESEEKFDWYIAGSDQIWNINCLGGLKTPYFLDFVPKNKTKMIYAASMGDYKLDDVYRDKFKELLDDLSYISVREKGSLYELQKLVKKRIEYVVDPVFLNSKEIWEGLLPEIDVQQPFAVCYFVRRSSRGEKIVRKVKREFKVPILNLSDNNIYIYGTSAKYISVGPLEFLTLIKNAMFTIGTSFHLTAFSVIFNRPTIVIGTEHNKERTQSLLELVDAKDNYISENFTYDSVTIRECVNRKYNYKKLDESIQKSKEYISQGEIDKESVED